MAEPSQDLQQRLREAVCICKHSLATERQYVHWARRYVRFHPARRPGALGAASIRAFLEDLAVSRAVSPATQHQALCAVVFFYGHVLGCEPGEFSDFVKARRRPGPAPARAVAGGRSGACSRSWTGSRPSWRCCSRAAGCDCRRHCACG